MREPELSINGLIDELEKVRAHSEDADETQDRYFVGSATALSC